MPNKPKNPVPVKKPAYGVEEKPSILRLAVMWGLIVCGIAGIVWMCMTASPEKHMTCKSPPGGNSLIGFGTCSEE